MKRYSMGILHRSTEFFKEEKEMIRVRQKYTFLESINNENRIGK